MRDWRFDFYNKYVSTGQSRGSHQDAPYSTHDFPYYTQRILKHIRGKEKQSILDIGCGAGGLMYCLQSWGFENVQGIDISEEQIEIAHSKGISSARNASFFEEFSHPSPSFDIIFAMDIIEHIPKSELVSFLEKVFKLLTTRGLFIIHVPNGQGIFGSSVFHSDITHESAFTDRSIRQVLAIAGFRTITVFEDKPVVHNMRSLFRRLLWSISTLPFRLAYLSETGVLPRALSQNILVVAQKD